MKNDNKIFSNKYELIIYFIILALALFFLKYLRPYFTINQNILFLVFSIVVLLFVSFIYVLVLNFKNQRCIFKRHPKYFSYLEEATRGMIFVRDIRKLQELIVRILTKALKISHVRLFLYNEKKQMFECVSKRGPERRRQIDSIFDHKHPLVKLVNREKTPMLIDNIQVEYVEKNRDIDFKRIEKDFRSLGTVLFIPEFIKGKFSGFISLGGKKDNKKYTKEDIEVLTDLSFHAGLALENAQFFNRIKEQEIDHVQTYKLMALGEMATSFAHQINNPLQSIVGSETITTMMLNDWKKHNIDNDTVSVDEINSIFDKINIQLTKVKTEVFHISEIVKTIMGVAKEVNFEEMNVHNLIDNSLNLIPKSKFCNNEIKIEKSIAEGLPNVYVRAIDIKQIIMNLGINAIEAMGRFGTLTIDVRRSQKKQDFIEINIKDTGHGIPKRIRDKIFDIFFTTKGIKGSGLGLPLVNKMVNDNKGHIEVDSIEGEGSTFTVYLPESIR